MFTLLQAESQVTTEPVHQQVARNLATVREQIRAACQDAGRQPDEVTLVAVTKYVGLAAIRALLAAGQRDLGESRVQQLMPRVETLASEDLPQPNWHLIGHLQRNKVKYLLPDVRIIHSVDSLRLAEQISQSAQKQVEQKHACEVEVFVEVNTSGETAKHGVAPEELDSLLETVTKLPHLKPVGLMTMASLVEDQQAARPYFARLRELLDSARQRGSIPADCRYLSMGMSGDFEAAIAEGATHVRIGSALFAGLSDVQKAED